MDRAITKLRDEWLNGEVFYALKEAKVRIEVGGRFAGHTTFDDRSHFEKGDHIIVDTDGETFSFRSEAPAAARALHGAAWRPGAGA